jgi:hypothetical protein
MASNTEARLVCGPQPYTTFTISTTVKTTHLPRSEKASPPLNNRRTWVSMTSKPRVGGSLRPRKGAVLGSRKPSPTARRWRASATTAARPAIGLVSALQQAEAHHRRPPSRAQFPWLPSRPSRKTLCPPPHPLLQSLAGAAKGSKGGKGTKGGKKGGKGRSNPLLEAGDVCNNCGKTGADP